MTQRLPREGSLAFSLAELSRLEDERQAIEREREARLVAASLEADREATRRRLAREAEEARIREELLREEEERAGEQKARLSAIEQAEVVRAKALAEAEASTRLAAEEHRHAEALAALSTLESIRTWKRVAMVSWVLCLTLLAVLAGVEFGVLRPESQRRVAAAEAGREAASGELRAVRGDLEEQRRAAQDLSGRLAEANLRAEASAKSLDAIRVELAHSNVPSVPGHPGGHPSTPHTGPFSNDCPPGSLDPLCGLTR
jgi:hypothetical protein